MPEKQFKLSLNLADYIIQINFNFSEQVVLEGELLGQIKKFWESFIVNASDKPDFSINFLPQKKGEKQTLVRDKVNYFFLGYKRNFNRKRITAYYSMGLSEFNLILKEILLYLISKDGGLVLHASSYLNNKTGLLYAFSAPSGGGKTTVAKMLENSNCVKFSDDLVLARILSGKWYFYTPSIIEKDFLPRKLKAEKIKIFFLKKAKEIKLKKLSSQAIPKLLLQQVWSQYGLINAKTFSYALRFIKDNNFYLLYATLEKEKMRKVIYEA